MRNTPLHTKEEKNIIGERSFGASSHAFYNHIGYFVCLAYRLAAPAPSPLSPRRFFFFFF